MPKFDFGGYATKNNLKCADGRTIRKDAFIDCDGMKVPLVWAHKHDDPGKVLVMRSLRTGKTAFTLTGPSTKPRLARTPRNLSSMVT